MSVIRSAAFFIGALALAGCAILGPSPTPTRGPGLFALPTVDTSGWNACAGVGLVDAKLAGDASDPRHAWLIANGSRLDVVFPARLGARFTPTLEIVDPAGVVVARAGDVIDGGCVTGVTDGAPLLILWP